MTESVKSLKERRLIAFTHLEEYIATFLERWSIPTCRLEVLTAALEEVATHRMLLYAERGDDVPSIRKRKARKD